MANVESLLISFIMQGNWRVATVQPLSDMTYTETLQFDKPRKKFVASIFLSGAGTNMC
jgi:hypothetical protein